MEKDLSVAMIFGVDCFCCCVQCLRETACKVQLCSMSDCFSPFLNMYVCCKPSSGSQRWIGKDNQCWTDRFLFCTDFMSSCYPQVLFSSVQYIFVCGVTQNVIFEIFFLYTEPVGILSLIRPPPQAGQVACIQSIHLRSLMNAVQAQQQLFLLM